MQNKIISINITETGSELISLSEVKEWLIVGHDEDNALLTRLIKGVRQAFEKWTKHILIASDVTLIAQVNNCEFRIPRLPIRSIVSVGIRQNDGSYEALTSDDYTQLGDSIIFEKLGIIQIEYSAGYDANDLPAGHPLPDDIKTSIFEEIAFRYDKRGVQGDIGFCSTAELYMTPYINMAYS